MKPIVVPCRAGVHVIDWAFSLRPPAELCPMAASNGTSPPLQVIIGVKLFAESIEVGKVKPAVNPAGSDESTEHGKPSAMK